MSNLADGLVSDFGLVKGEDPTIIVLVENIKSSCTAIRCGANHEGRKERT
jgi:hypothetical protein